MVARFFQKSLATVTQPPPNAKIPTPKKQIWVGMSSDRGLCGGINSTIARAIRDSILATPNEISDRGIVLYGEKSRAALNTQFGHLFRIALSDCDKLKPVTFYACGELADYWLAQKADKSLFFFQKFKSMIAYATTVEEHYSYDFFKDTLESALALYEPEGPDDMMRNLLEYTAAVKLFYYFAENNASTLSARMQAMGNSSTSANEMLSSLTLFLNRSRQAKITTELSEIVGGAAAIDDEEDDQDVADSIPSYGQDQQDGVPKEDIAAAEKEEDDLDAVQAEAILSGFDVYEKSLDSEVPLPELEQEPQEEFEEAPEIDVFGLAEAEAQEKPEDDYDELFDGPDYTDEEFAAQQAAILEAEEKARAKASGSA